MKWLIGLILVILASLFTYLGYVDRIPQIIFLDVGQGDATLIDTGTHQILIDCGIDARVLESLGAGLPFWDKHIDILIITHPDLDHYGGCEDVLRSFSVSQVWTNGEVKSSDAFTSFIQTAQENGHLYAVAQPQRIDLGVFGIIDVLFPVSAMDDLFIEAKGNNASIILHIPFCQDHVLLMGDAERELEDWLVERYGQQLRSAVLKAGHHGSDTSSQQSFLDIVQPHVVMISAGADNRFGHPHKEVLERFEAGRAQIYRTDQQGNISLRCQDDTFVIETDRVLRDEDK